MQRSAARTRIGAALAVTAVVTFAQGCWGDAAPLQTFSTDMGEVRTVELPDSTRVTLAPLTELRVDAKFGRDLRSVTLNGEAWFEVKPDSSRAFQVRAFGVVAENRGATFNARAMISDSIVAVFVASGGASVRLAGQGANEGAQLRAGDAVTLDAKTFKAHITRNVAIDAVAPWRNGILSFDNVALSTVARELTRWYGVSLRFQPPNTATRTFSGQFPTDNLNAALSELSATVNVQFERKGDTFFVKIDDRR